MTETANTSDKDTIHSLFKPGYVFKVEVYDFDSPEIKNEIAKALCEQQEIVDRMKLPSVIEEKSIRA